MLSNLCVGYHDNYIARRAKTAGILLILEFNTIRIYKAS